MTSDGIDTNDWEKVSDIVHKIIEASFEKDNLEDEVQHGLLFNLLTDLEIKYGPKPSLLATRGDFMTDEKEKIKLLIQAYDEAVRIDDGNNKLLISTSLAEFMIEDRCDFKMGSKWLCVMKNDLSYSNDEDELTRYEELKNLLLLLK